MEKSLAYGFDYMCKDELCSTVLVYSDGSVFVKDYTDIMIKLPFGTWGSEADLKDVEEFLESRCFPRTRGNCKQVLKSGGIQFYNPLEICLKTEGRLSDDVFWLRFFESMKEMKHPL